MAGKKAFSQVVKFLAKNGYAHDHTNEKGGRVFVRDGFEPVRVWPWISDRDATNLIRNLSKACGGESDRRASKRNPDQIKARQAEERSRAEAEVVRRRKEIDALLAERDARMLRAGFRGNEPDFVEFLARIEREERELLFWQRLMSEVPRNENKVRHRS